MVNGMYLYSTFIQVRRLDQSALHYIHSPIHTHTHTLMVASYIVATAALGLTDRSGAAVHWRHRAL